MSNSTECDITNYDEVTYGKTYFKIYINSSTFSGKFYTVMNLLCICYYVIPLIWMVKYKDWHVFKQRNFILTFVGGIANLISTLSNSLTQIFLMPCMLEYYSATVATFIMQLCYVFRAFRLIFLYKLNIFKVSELSENKFVKSIKNGNIIEPNKYYKSIYTMVNKRLIGIVMPILIIIVTIISVVVHILVNINGNRKNGMICGITLTNINGKINGALYAEIQNKKNMNENLQNSFYIMDTMFRIPEFITLFFILSCIIITIIFTVTDIKDDQKFGIKFDCFSTAIVNIIISSIYFIFKKYRIEILRCHDNRIWTPSQLYIRTKGGILLFIFSGIYIQLTSVVIPLIKCIQSKQIMEKYENEPTNTIEYFYKVLNTPSMVEQLKTIAIRLFSVENVLFWENYCTLHKITSRVKSRYEHHNHKSKALGAFLLDSSTNSESSITMEEESYDPNYPLLEELIPYYKSFYYTFIDIDGPAAVNLNNSTITDIRECFAKYPVIGIFDEAKDEIVDSMFFSLFPILLQQNKKELGEIFIDGDK
ncbi:hypothetical protein BCR32DRAFT_291890 [Anaeromyces robustus]|uniref:RGS domain-containing protein n=1 Tax=Anaeromyces robustus TaxID=1754192 RepID=A0A1Y1XDV9_9FUNG|nr:hypothetical protein BCR32DRAFT_291890 [Anaeromyces robustus]|eukprot:ORX83564.1 hypothetical protein BCR32DRAFT_291890 [Anaeromyces robustus]